MRSGPQAQASSSILLVDDNRDGNMARRSVLEELGYEVLSATSGKDALKAIEQRACDLVVTDYKMTPMNGVELIAKLREREFKKPIILLTGFAESLGLKPENTGADIVLQKCSNEVATLVRHTKRLLAVPRKPARSQGTPKTALRSKGENA